MPLLSGYSPPHRHNAGWLQPPLLGFQCAVSCHYIQGTIEVGRFARVIEDGIPLWGSKSEEPAFPLCLDPWIAACRSLQNLSSSEQIQTSNLLYINVHQCTSYTNLFMVFFHCAHNSQFPRAGAAHLQSLERSRAQSSGQTPSSQPPV